MVHTEEYGKNEMSDNIWEKQASMLRADLKVLQSFIDDLDDSKASEAFYNVRGSVIAYLHSGTPASPVRWPVVEFVDDLCARQVELPPDFAEVLHSMTNEPIAARELDVEAERREFNEWFERAKFGGMRESMWAAWEARAARSAAQSTAPVSTEQAGDAALPEPSPLYFQALELVRDAERASVSMVQRRLRIGWDAARDLIELMVTRGDIPELWASKFTGVVRAPSPNNSPVGADKEPK